MFCYICDQDNWHSMAHLNKERELRICKVCGNAAYKVEPEEEKKVLDYYRYQYRPAPNITNLITCNHKQQYIANFLSDFIKDKKGLICGDVGSAIGYIPNMLRRAGHKATGCELTLTYRRFSEHFYGIPLTEDLSSKYKYDLITIYHVLEHLIEPDKKLKKYVDMLKDDGRIMISTPEWFDTLEEASGSQLTTFEHLFHKDHINVFSKASIQNLFYKCGLEIEKENHITYGQTYFLKKATSKKELVYEKLEDQIDKTEKCYQAINLFRSNKVMEALEVWPKMPDSWLKLIFELHLKVPEKQEELFGKAFKVLPESCRLKLAYAVWLYQQQRYEESLKEFDWLMVWRPNEDVLMYRGWCFANLGKHREAMASCEQSFQMNPQKWAEALNWMCNQAVQMLTWDELAEQSIKEQLFKKAAPVIEPKDPVMEAK